MLRYEILQVRLDYLIIVSIAFSRLQYLEHDILGPLALLPFRSDFLTVENLELVSFEIFLTMNGELRCLLHLDFFLLHVLPDLKTHFISGTYGDIYLEDVWSHCATVAQSSNGESHVLAFLVLPAVDHCGAVLPVAPPINVVNTALSLLTAPYSHGFT